MTITSPAGAPDAGLGEHWPRMTLAGAVVHVLESCAYRWFFDAERHRFRRVPRTGQLDGFSEVPWQDYASVAVSADGNSFVVSLDVHGTRLLSATGHGASCTCDHL
ncbi:MAG: hypothetical protein M3P34_11165 [Actinomycetota bacterium]|nr:hypothetical protein [Actinomycetota bacterium]